MVGILNLCLSSFYPAITGAWLMFGAFDENSSYEHATRGIARGYFSRGLTPLSGSVTAAIGV